jgi:DNA-binding XRE family transcriptional regulator
MPGGRPPKMTPALIAQIAELFFLAFTDQQIALIVGVSAKTIQRARNGTFCPTIKIAELKREAIYRKKIWEAKGFWQGAAWFLERKYPTQFAKPEIQLNWNNSYTQNNLSINISGQEAKQIESEAKPVRDAVSSMFQQYRPGNGNGKSDDTSSKKNDDM